MFDIFLSANAQWVMAGAALLGLASGVTGSFVLLRKESLIGDAMAHAALPGICFGFFIFGRETIALMAGAALTGLLAIYSIRAIAAKSRIKQDAAIGIVLSVFFGFGIVLLTRITNGSSGNKGGLDDFIFGQAASLVGRDVQILMGAATLLLLLAFLFFKELKLLIFDPLFAGGIGLPVKWLNGLLSSMVVLIVITGIQTVGVVLMAAMLITPAVAAKYWTDKLSVMAVLAGLIGAFSGAFGAAASSSVTNLPTGPVIVVAATVVFLFSLLFSPKRGLAANALRNRKFSVEIWKQQLLRSVFNLLEERYKNNINSASFTLNDLTSHIHLPEKQTKKTLKILQQHHLITSTRDNSAYLLTEKGLEYSYEAALHQRIYDVFLMYEDELGVFHDEDVGRRTIDRLPEQMKERAYELMRRENLEPVTISQKNGLIATVQQ
ncbi:metal ABC transporter permease [Alteribacillus sp. HJP-4]|uniref:metal ABC transporter permease n=1 Tax=Alteribacillus sp. HJP-4 TaxID=2775394 RepID=UPI0035CD2F11